MHQAQEDAEEAGVNEVGVGDSEEGGKPDESDEMAAFVNRTRGGK